METKTRGILRMTAVLALLLVAGCGSNGSGGSGTAVAIASGQIIDSLVQGLDYRSASTTGLTDAQGTFSYGVGEKVTFSIGNLVLGSTDGKSITTLLDLVDGACFTTLQWGTPGISSSRVKNIARLLQSLDSDCNVRNGIQITSQIRAEVSPRVIDFDQSPREFGSDPVIADLFNRLNLAGAFTGGCVGALRPESVAVDHLVKSINDTWVLASGAIDFEGDGVIDATKRLVRDEKGRIIELSDFNYNGAFYWEYDDANLSAIMRRDDGMDGSIDYILAFKYDAAGNIIEERHDTNGDGVVDEIDTYTRDAFGREINHLWRQCSNGQTYRYITEYDADGIVTLEKTDSGDDGTFEYVSLYTIVDGKRVREDYTYPSGTQLRLYTYDGDNLISETYDWQNDGVFEYRTDYTYDSRGNVLTAKAYTWKNVGGVFTYFLDYEDAFVYDANGLYIEHNQVYHFSNGNPDETLRQTLTRDANGNVTRMVFINRGAPPQIETFTWEQQSIPSEFNIYVPADWMMYEA